VQEQHEDPTHEKIKEGTTIETKAGKQASAPAPEELKKLQLKHLLINLRYKFLNPEETSPVIINVSLYQKHIVKLLEALRNHKGMIGYSIKDLKCLNPTVCTHRILLKENHKPSIKH
jgi:hypothetical protein